MFRPLSLNHITLFDMEESEKEPSLSYRNFLETVEKYGAYCTIWDAEKKNKLAYFIRKGSKPGTGPNDHFITDENMIDFRACTRRERRQNFHKRAA